MSTEAIELFHADGKPSGVWYCSECRAVHAELRTAQSCHGITHCEKCGKELGKRQPFKTHCQECDNEIWREKQAKEEFERYTKAVKIRASEYTGPQVYFGDRYYDTVEDAVDGCDQLPEYIWSAKDVGLKKATIEDLVDPILEEAWEDADIDARSNSTANRLGIDALNGTAELQRAIDLFNESNADISVYLVDYNEALVLDDEIIAEWRQNGKNAVTEG